MRRHSRGWVGGKILVNWLVRDKFPMHGFHGGRKYFSAWKISKFHPPRTNEWWFLFFKSCIIWKITLGKGGKGEKHIISPYLVFAHISNHTSHQHRSQKCLYINMWMCKQLVLIQLVQHYSRHKMEAAFMSQWNLLDGLMLKLAVRILAAILLWLNVPSNSRKLSTSSVATVRFFMINFSLAEAKKLRFLWNDIASVTV